MRTDTVACAIDDKGPAAMLNQFLRLVISDKWTFTFAILLVVGLILSGLHVGISIFAGLLMIVPIFLRPAINSVAPPAGGDGSAMTSDRERVPDRLDNARLILAALDNPVYILDGHANVLCENPAATRTFGDIPVGQHISARLRAPSILEIIRETIDTGEPNEVVHYERLPSEEVFLVRVVPVSGGSGVENLYIVVFRNVSDAHRMERMRSDFVANASHELRTPLASLRGFIETMQGPARDDEAAREKFLGIMLEQVLRMSRLVDDLLSLSRLELKSRVLPQGSVELVSLIRSVADSLAPMAGELGVSINLALPEDARTVTGDQDELTEVFENLIENACKYGQSGKLVDVALAGGLEGGPVEVTVSDHGPGIAEVHVPRLTERFYRVDVENSRLKKGTGLGLAIVKHILTRHRARLVIRSELGRGSTFTVRF